MSQYAIAQQIGTNKSNLSNIERGTAKPTLLTLSRIAAALEVDIQDLLGPDAG